MKRNSQNRGDLMSVITRTLIRHPLIIFIIVVLIAATLKIGTKLNWGMDESSKELTLIIAVLALVAFFFGGLYLLSAMAKNISQGIVADSQALLQDLHVDDAHLSKMSLNDLLDLQKLYTNLGRQADADHLSTFIVGISKSGGNALGS